MSDSFDSTSPQFVMPGPTDAERYRAELDAVRRSRPDHHGAAVTPLTLESSGADQGVELPAGLIEVLVHAARALSEDRAVTLTSTPEMITTLETAELLGLRYSVVIELLAEGRLTAEPSSGGRPRLRLTDVLAYRDDLHERRSQFIAETF